MSCDYEQCMVDLYGDDAAVVVEVGEDGDGGIVEEGGGDSEGDADWDEDEKAVLEVESSDESDEDEYLRDILESIADDDDTYDAEDSSTWDSSEGEEYDS